MLDRASRSDERLARDLSAEHALALLVGLTPAEDVDLDRLEVEQLDQVVERARPTLGRHSVMLTGTVPRMTTGTFPDGFRWGTATAAHQVEGGNWNNDWWEWEHTPGSGCVEPSGDACDHYNR